MSAHTAPEPEPGYSMQELLAACAAANAVCTPPAEPEAPEPEATPEEPVKRPEADAA
ncbi:hypothetical protein [Streptomyces sp. NPDC026673]|uniref:hypothetical protein n=1 Tax=Streptomyces sp. NPDC026673 TaxID=3155724 RepID=UPI0033C1C554